MTVQVFDPRNRQLIVFTQAAADKVKSIRKKKVQDALKLQLYSTGGGCSGFQYSFTFAEQADEEDSVIEKDQAQLLVDPLSFSYLQGAEVDYIEGLQGAKFVVNNPNAKATCSCGASFTI